MVATQSSFFSPSDIKGYSLGPRYGQEFRTRNDMMAITTVIAVVLTITTVLTLAAIFAKIITIDTIVTSLTIIAVITVVTISYYYSK